MSEENSNQQTTVNPENLKDQVVPSEEEMEENESVTEEPKTETDVIQGLKEELQKKDSDLVEANNQVLRIRAETENFKKRLLKEKSDLALYSNEKLIKELLPIYDNLERALAAPDTNIKVLKDGVQMILKQFSAFLEKEKIETIAALGEKFDPSRHEALQQIDSDVHDESTVVEEYSKGYLLHGRVLVPARVVITRKPVTPPADPIEEVETLQ